MTFLELFASVYMTPQEVCIETGIPLVRIYRARDGQSISERDARRILQAINTRRKTKVTLVDLPRTQIQWETA